MNKVTKGALAAAAAGALLGSMALPASAANTATTVTINGGSIAITAPTSAAFGSLNPGAIATLPLNEVQVRDSRAGITGWTATVSSTNFKSEAREIPATNLSYTAGIATVTGIAVVATTLVQVDLSTAKPVQIATAVVGNNTATWTGTLALTVPSDALAGDYTAVVTHSAS